MGLWKGLVAQGSGQQEGINFDETFSPVVKPTTIRLVLSLAISYGWTIRQLDAKKALIFYMVMRSSRGLFLSQHKYTTDLTCKFHLHTAKLVCTPLPFRTTLSLTDGELLADPSEYRSMVGALQYLNMTRPDLTYVVHLLSQFMHAPHTSHLAAVKRIYSYRRSWHLVSSIKGQAEYRAVAYTIADTLHIRTLLSELGLVVKHPIKLMCDNVSTTYLTINPIQHKRNKHIKIDYHFVREQVAHGDLIVRYVPT
ncbi:uncharacterized protein LOC110694344 [Chenopodium quinoa]|uniref:uncharacterized protein LOC110694344 n=1 Tax=Chenopodium quinoa TaxID=63459 RepID=UPI000B77B65F|nr:uncharacterized protein LOC110694344 [Chenopodium quinoa]